MPSYYVPKKNRCNCDSSGNCCMSPFKLFFATSSSMNTSVDKSSTVYTSDKSTEGNSSNAVGKGIGNTRFMGSGGNSYDAYLAKKKGQIYCDCNVTK